MTRPRVRPSRFRLLLALAVVGLIPALLLAASGRGPLPLESAATLPATRPARLLQSIEDDRLENAHFVTAEVISGAQPHDEPSFAALAELGVKTIISVDGARPDADTARRYGMRYVHIPITYGTVTPEQAQALAKAVDGLPGPVYIHCHHGKHRSAAATAVACVLTGAIPRDRAEDVLHTFGTGENYDGLWEAAREARPLDEGELKALRAMPMDFVEAAPVPAMAEAMVGIDFYTDNLRAIQKAGWAPPADHPDLSPAHEALQLEEYLRELGRTPATLERSDEFRRLLAESETAARGLREQLRLAPVNPESADAALKLVTASCRPATALFGIEDAFGAACFAFKAGSDDLRRSHDVSFSSSPPVPFPPRHRASARRRRQGERHHRGARRRPEDPRNTDSLKK